MHSTLLARMAEQKDLVLKLALELDQAASSEDKIRIQKQLQEESNKLARMVTGFRRRMLRSGTRGLAVEDVTPEQAKARTSIVLQRIQAVNKEIAQVAKLWNENKGNAYVRQNIRMKYQILLTERVHLQRRLTLLQHGRDFVMPRKISAHQVRVARKRLGLPPMFHTPTVDDTGALIALLVTRIERRKEDTDATFRERLLAYLRRALLRWSHRKMAGGPADEAVVGAVAETLQEDSAALEAEADAGGTIADPVTDVFVPLTESEPVQEQVDNAIDNLHPSVAVQADPSTTVVEAETLIHEMSAPTGSDMGQTLDLTAATAAIAPTPSAAYYPGTEPLSIPTPSVSLPSAPPPQSTPSRSPKRKRTPIRVPRVPTFAKAGSRKAQTSASAPTSAAAPTMMATDTVTGEEVEVMVPQEASAEETAAAEQAGTNRMLMIGVGVALLVGGYLVLRRKD